jgi:hypothetical protein
LGASKISLLGSFLVYGYGRLLTSWWLGVWKI